MKCPSCTGYREVIRNQQEFILNIKKLIADYSGENDHWEKIRANRSKPARR